VTDLHEPVLAWFATHARALAWREPGTTPWAVLVSEVMLQQTPVHRVEPVYRSWMARWPAPADLAAEPVGEVIRAWGRLGYPRRAVRLHSCATAVVDDHDGVVPSDPAVLRELPGVGEYTAAAVAAFAYGRRVSVLDTNVRRVLARARAGVQWPPAHATAAQQALADELLPAAAEVAARWSVAVMELGALVCTARSPDCDSCPLAAQCAWLAAGRPSTPPPRRAQPFAGTDREVRGRLMQVLRTQDAPVTRSRLDAVWPDEEQRERALTSLLDDGLAVTDAAGRFHLPGT
jgi:A/G-specific adenine glycosylase